MDEQIVDVAVVGGGIIGLSAAWRLAERGRSVTVLEKGEAGRGASWAAAGMLSPAAEIGFEELDLYRLGRESLRRWPEFAKQLERASGSSVGYRDDGTLVVAVDRDDTEALRRLYRFQQEQGVPVEWLAGAEALEIEPILAPGLPAAIFSPHDHQVDNRGVVEALLKVLHEVDGGTVRESSKVRAVDGRGDVSVVVMEDGSSVEARVVVLAAGAWSREVGGIEPRLPVRPVKGQILSLRMKEPFELTHVVRGPDAYLVPKADGRLVVGATSEEQGFDTEVTAGGVYRLLEGAVEVVPGIEELELIETSVGFRPASRDHAPLIGWVAPNVMAATGQYRHGILLAPVTADEVALEVDAKLGERSETSEWLTPFLPDRF
ncbi:MAG: glycine oxidase ThiO [Bacteroidetes bacterium]|nr:glycine oxidase ThiO [Bacteroidota bacterium]